MLDLKEGDCKDGMQREDITKVWKITFRLGDL